jgi:hypothetical protein
MNETEKVNPILDYKNIVRRLKETIGCTAGEAMDFRPKNDYWTIREHIAHIMDCEIFGFTRYRKSIAEPNTTVEGFNQEHWQANLDYRIMDISKAMRIIETLNYITTDHLLTITSKNWDSYYIEHPKRGNENLSKLINRRISHIKEHIGYINRNKALFDDKGRFVS